MKHPRPGPQRPPSRIGLAIMHIIAWAFLLAIVLLTINNVEADSSIRLEPRPPINWNLDRDREAQRADEAARDRRYMLEELRDLRDEQERMRRELRDCQDLKAIYGSSYQCY